MGDTVENVAQIQKQGKRCIPNFQMHPSKMVQTGAPVGPKSKLSIRKLTI